MVAVPEGFKTIFVNGKIKCGFCFCICYGVWNGWCCLLLLEQNFFKGDNAQCGWWNIEKPGQYTATCNGVQPDIPFFHVSYGFLRQTEHSCESFLTPQGMAFLLHLTMSPDGLSRIDFILKGGEPEED